MAKQSQQTRGGLSLGKVVVIGTLSIVLLVTIVVQFGDRKQPDAPPTVVRPTPSAKREPPGPSAPTATKKRPENTWPTFNVAEVVRSNPFTLPAALLPELETGQTLTPTSTLGETEASILAFESARDREMRRRQAEFIAGLRAQGVDMILRSPRGSVARIGELSLRVGDVHEGLRVEEIGTDGVIFAPVTVPKGQAE